MKKVDINCGENFEFEFKDSAQNIAFLNTDSIEIALLSIKYNNNFSGLLEINTANGLFKKNIAKHKKSKPVSMEVNFRSFKSDMGVIDLNQMVVSEVNVVMNDLSGGQLSIDGFDGKKVVFKFV